jgi:hypothetical protein
MNPILSSPAHTRSSSECGSVFIYIMIGVFLFAALSYAVATSMRGNTGVSSERQKLAAAEIIATGNRFTEAVTRLRLKGVEKRAISFENNIDLAYTNPNCTTDECRVFANAGGGLSWETPPPNITAAPWFFSGGIAVDGIGSAAGDLAIYLPVIPADVCSQINELLGNTNRGEAVPVVAANINGLDQFVGTYANALMSTPRLVGKKAGCAQVNSITGSLVGTVNNAYHYYHILVAN